MPKKKNAVRKDGRIKVSVYIGRDENGKKKYKYAYGSTQKEADAEAERIKISLRKGLDVMAENDTFGEWAEQWLNIKRNEVSVGQLSSYQSAIKHLNKHLEYVSITKIRQVDIQNVILDLAAKNPHTGKPTAKQTLRIVKISASQIFQLAIENRVIEYNPTLGVKLPKNAPEDTRRALTPTEQSWIREMPHRAQIAAMIMMYAGLRRGEVIPLTWNDIDFRNSIISVNKSVEKLNGKFFIKQSAKTDAGLRTIKIPRLLVDFLSNQKQKHIYLTKRKTAHRFIMAKNVGELP